MNEGNEEKAGFYGWGIETPEEKREKLKKEKASYSTITILVGLIILSFCMFMVLDAYRVLSNPLFSLQSDDTKVAAWSQLGIGIFGVFGGLVFMIKGFIDYYKYG